jgi:simple sugar transport system substrate-binding protein
MTQRLTPSRRRSVAAAGLAAAGLLILTACTQASGGGSGDDAAASGGWCDGMTIRFFAGGSPGDGFAPVLAKGAQQAGEDLGAKVDVVYSDWKPEKMLSDLRDAIASKPDGIAFTGHPGDDAVMPLAADAADAGILMTYQNVDVPTVRAQYGGGFVGADLQKQGAALATEALNTLDLKSGDRALVMGPFGDQARAVREESAAKTLEAGGITVDRVTPPLEAFTDPNLLTPVITGYLQSHPDTRLVVYSGTTLGSAPQYMEAANKKPGDVLNIGFDLTPATLEAITSGYVQITADQQPFLQGYLPVMNLCQRHTYQMGALVVDTGAGFDTKENAGDVADLVDQGIR